MSTERMIAKGWVLVQSFHSPPFSSSASEHREILCRRSGDNLEVIVERNDEELVEVMLIPPPWCMRLKKKGPAKP